MELVSRRACHEERYDYVQMAIIENSELLLALLPIPSYDQPRLMRSRSAFEGDEPC